jgi:hypothetical protein
MSGPARFALVAVLTLGCSSGSPTGTVNGTVTFDGQPLKEGTVRFVPADAKTPAVTAPVTDGKFTIAAPVGENRVEFSAAKVVGKIKMYDTPDSPTVDLTKETLPDKYNVRSTLNTTVKSGSQDETYALTTK